jgi:cobalt/nickel transport system permease protein
MHHPIDALACQNRLRYLPSTHKLGFTVVLFILGYFSPWWGQLLITLWLGVAIVGYAGIPWYIYIQLQMIPLGFWLLSLPPLLLGITSLNNLPYGDLELWQGLRVGDWYVYLSKQGIEQGITVLGRAIALSSSMYFMLLTTPFVEILRICQRLRFPTLILELLALMYRFIFLLSDTALELVNAQKSRHGYRTWKTSMVSLSLVISQLLRRSLDNYREISLGLTARGFNGELKVWHSRRRYQGSLRYGLEAVGGCLVLLILMGWYYLSR